MTEQQYNMFESRIGLMRLDLDDAGLMQYSDDDPLYLALCAVSDALLDAFDGTGSTLRDEAARLGL